MTYRLASSKISRQALEDMSERAGVPISEYIGNRKPVINGKCYSSFRAAYAYLYSQLRKNRSTRH